MRWELQLGYSAVVLMALGCAGQAVQTGTSSNGGTSSVCATGSERCACYGNSTCDQGLECRSNLCVAGGNGGSSGAGGATSTGAVGTTNVACLYNNRTYVPGASIPSGDACISCYCSSSGQIACNSTICLAAGGSNNAGGMVATGGMATGGIMATGGRMPATGGRTAPGGATATGGSSANGCQVGSQGCPCYASNLCATPTVLSCVNATCCTLAGDCSRPALSSGGAAGTGGASSVAGSGGFDPNTYCNGILQGKSCSLPMVQANLRAVNMLLVLDESGSMNDPPVSGAPSKWTIVKQALNTALSPVNDDINFGLLLFPYLAGGIPAGSTSQADNCAVADDVALAVNVPITARPAGLQNVLDTVNGQSPAGGTPTAKALKQAYAYFTTGTGRNLTGSKWVLLVTDGGPNCNAGLTCTAQTCTQNIDGKCATNINCCDSSGFICLDDAATTSQIQQLAAAGVKTFVVGIPGTEVYATSLNNFANAGKVPNAAGANGSTYYAISAGSAQQDLTNALSKITSQLAKTCDIPLTSNPTDSTKVNVTIGCVLQSPTQPGADADAAAGNGYYIDYTTSPPHLKLVGAPCASISNNGTQPVDLIVGCPTVN